MTPLRILFIAPYVPSRIRVRPYNLIKHLAADGHRVTVLAASTSQRDDADAAVLREECERVETVRVPMARSLWNCVRGVGAAVPLQALYCYSPTLAQRAQTLLRVSADSNGSGAFDIVQVEHLRAARLGLGPSGLPRIFDAVDSISRLFTQAARLGPTSLSRLIARLDLPRTARFEGWLMHQFDRVLTTSQAECDALGELAQKSAPERDPGVVSANRISVLPNGVDLEYFKPSDQPRGGTTIVYLGRMSYHANVAAVRQLIEAIMPRIWAQRPEVRLLVVGTDPSAQVRALARRHAARVHLTGRVPDVRPYLARASVCVSPLLYAAGIQNKVLEALAMETPVVTSTAGCAALEVKDGEHLLVADDPGVFADRVVALLGDELQQRRLGTAGRRFVEAHHDWRHATRRLALLYTDTIAAFQRRRTPALAEAR